MRAGSILVIALWVLFLLTVMAVTVSAGVRQKAVFVQRFDEIERLRYISEAGIFKVIAMLQDKVDVGYDSLKSGWALASAAYQDIPVSQGFVSIRSDWYDPGIDTQVARPGIVDEERKVNINTAGLGVLTGLFAAVLGIESTHAAELAASVIDWRDADSVLTIPSGSAENPDYSSLPFPYQAKDALIESPDELALVKGFGAADVARLAPYVTVYTDGRVNVNTAPAVVLTALGIPERAAQKIVAFRAGSDRIEGTEDDVPITETGSLGAVLLAAGLIDANARAQLDQVAGLYLTTTSNIFSISAVSRLPKRTSTKTTLCVFKRDNRQILYWKE